ncbi:hypothetical protein VNO80_24854 [Phaseolus coccineus]|uniref:Uncharacterized protein n=1 Tax=Phaseolus coccineus TaxID=3886 RepID=A0AAN9QSR7_PHACN
MRSGVYSPMKLISVVLVASFSAVSTVLLLFGPRGNGSVGILPMTGSNEALLLISLLALECSFTYGIDQSVSKSAAGIIFCTVYISQLFEAEPEIMYVDGVCLSAHIS